MSEPAVFMDAADVSIEAWNARHDAKKRREVDADPRPEDVRDLDQGADQ